MKEFTKNYFLGFWFMLLNLPRFMAFMLFLIAPIYGITMLLHLGGINGDIPSLVGMLGGLYIAMETPYRSILNKVSPFGPEHHGD